MFIQYVWLCKWAVYRLSYESDARHAVQHACTVLIRLILCHFLADILLCCGRVLDYWIHCDSRISVVIIIFRTLTDFACFSVNKFVYFHNILIRPIVRLA